MDNILDLAYYKTLLKRDYSKGVEFLKTVLLNEENALELINDKNAILTIYDESDNESYKLSYILNDSKYGEQAIKNYFKFAHNIEINESIDEYTSLTTNIQFILSKKNLFINIFSILENKEDVLNKIFNSSDCIEELVKDEDKLLKFILFGYADMLFNIPNAIKTMFSSKLILDYFYENANIFTEKIQSNQNILNFLNSNATEFKSPQENDSMQILYNNKAFLLKSKAGTDYSAGGAHMLITGDFVLGNKTRSRPLGLNINMIEYYSYNEFVSRVTLQEKWGKKGAVKAYIW